MKMTLMIILILICRPASAPGFRELYIVKSERINEYDRLFKAICFIESSNRDSIVNPLEGAYGRAQIRKCRLDEYNSRTGKNYILTDCFNPDIAKEIFYYYCKGRSYEVISRAWVSGESGSKKASEPYYQKVKKSL